MSFKTPTTWIFLMVLFACSKAWAQGDQLSRIVSLNIQNQPLREVLQTISQDYQVVFSYGEEFIPTAEKVTVQVKKEPLSHALDQLYLQAGVIYAPIGRQIVLKTDPAWRRPQLSQIQTDKFTSPPEKKEMPPNISSPKLNSLHPARGGDSYQFADQELHAMLTSFEPITREKKIEHKIKARISIFPERENASERNENETSNLSVNVTWGESQEVKGVEIGGLGNNVRGNLDGIQVAGIVNEVGGNVSAIQVGGIANINRGTTHGIQVAGLTNVSKSHFHGVQSAGLINIAGGEFKGLQGAGLVNIIKKSGNRSTQIAGLVNVTKGENIGSQVAGIYNSGNRVRGSQIGLINRAKRVEGAQLGLINIADTIAGAPIGLLSLVGKGYNRMEFAVDDLWMVSASFKPGNRKFYNIFSLGWHPQSSSWAIGYGFGFAPKIAANWYLNTEIQIDKLNENDFWTDDLHLRNQLKINADYIFSDRLSAFFGPTLNVITSRRQDIEKGMIGSELPSHTFYSEIVSGTKVQSWIGFQAGIRF